MKNETIETKEATETTETADARATSLSVSMLVVGFIITMLTVCFAKVSPLIVEAKSESYFVQISNEADGSGTIWYDSRTGVQYWISNSIDNRGVCTPLIDETGKPLLYEPLRYDKKSDKSK